MMRFFGIFERKKQIPGRSCARSSVYPTNSNGQDVYVVNLAKVIDRLGPSTPQELREVNKLLSRGCLRDHPTDVDLVNGNITEEINLENLVEHGEKSAVQNPSSIDMPAKLDSVQGSVKTYRQARPAKLSFINKDKEASLINRDWHSERTTAPYPSSNRDRKDASSAENFPVHFPLPSPIEKHYLPTPGTRAVEDVSFVAHPLPHPPTTARVVNIGCIEDKGQSSIVRAASCESLVKPNLNAKECDPIARAGSFEPPRQIMQKTKMSQISGGNFPVLPQSQQTMPVMAPQSQVYQTPQSTPPATPHPQVRWTPQGTPLTRPRPHVHHTLQNIPQVTLHWQVPHTPQETTSTTMCAQCTSPSMPCLQLHPQVPANKTQKMQPPSSPNSRQSPRVTSQVQNQLESCFPPEQAHFAPSPPCSPLQRPLCPRNWRKGNILGQGSFGTVYEGLNQDDGSFFAVKVSSREDISPEIQQEVDVLSKLDHPNIVRYLGSSIVERRLCIFLELVSRGSLGSNLRKYKCFEDHTIRNYTKQILLGLEYLHRKRTIHRDIKCANILVDVNGQVKLSDFGIAKQVGESLVSSVKGTPLYMAPEVLTSNGECYSFPADIWSLGCTVLEMADGKPPWSNLKGFGFYFKVKDGELPPLPNNLSREGKDFIQCCLRKDPKDRPTASELLQHPFVLNAVTPESFFTQSPPPSPLKPIMWPPKSQLSNNTWACGSFCPLSPSQVMTGYQRFQTIIHGR